jgi:3-oxoacyl-[acyl-carrier protein] reductase
MLMSIVEDACTVPLYSELAGKRVLVTGVTGSCGVDVVRAFAEHRARLVLQFAEDSEETQAVAEIAAPLALDIMAFGPVAQDQAAAVHFARRAAQAYGGLDAVINLVPLAPDALSADAGERDIERMVADRLRLPLIVSQTAANRMTLALTEGLILNVAMLAQPARGHSLAFAAAMKAALTALTRAQAEEWASRGIRFNAIAPPVVPGLLDRGSGPLIGGEADIAALGLYLASGRGRELTGHVFEAQAPL